MPIVRPQSATTAVDTFRHRHLTRWMCLVAVVLVVAACSGSGAGGDDPAQDDTPERPDPVSVEPDADDFYDVPDPLPPGQHGDLVRYQLAADPPDGVTWYRVMYLSETVDGEATVVTGVVTVPDGEAPAGGWPLVSHAHGGIGIADDCAPSANLGTVGPTTIEIGLLSAYAETRGYVVASTDYEGLGGPGRHPFLVGQSEGRGVLDIALAARQIPDIEVGASTAISGYSQGGHAALWASQIAEEWTPDLDIIGTMAGAPASELADLSTMQAAAQSQGLVLLLLLGGFEATYPQADPTEILTPAGLDALDGMDATCVEVPEIDPDTTVFQADPAGTEPWPALLEENTPGATAASAPVLVIHSAVDLIVPVESSASLLDRLCAAGQEVERRILPEGDHVIAAVPAYEQGFDWFDALASGQEPVSSCP